MQTHDERLPTQGVRTPSIGIEAYIEVTHLRPPGADDGGQEWDSKGPGSLKWRYRGGDTIQNSGLRHLNRLLGSPTTVYSSDVLGARVAYSALGTGVGVTGSIGTALGSEVYRGTYSWTEGVVGSAALNRDFAIGSTYAIRESALFTGSSVTSKGTMYSRGTFPVRNVNDGDTITLNYTTGFVAG